MLQFTGMNTKHAQSIWQGGTDSHGNMPELAHSDGSANPCRHCLAMIGKDVPYFVLSYRPFDSTQPYAEQGPIFLHAEPCQPYQHLLSTKPDLPPVLHSSPRYMIRGYGPDERIVYGTGTISESEMLVEGARKLLARADIEFVDVRSASNNCWQARIVVSGPDDQ